ncbi:MAG: hypothetical protein GY863_23475 [bacterium]|nr:hypothetical protein [bacterium]
MEKSDIKKPVLIRMMLRSFLIQASFTYKDKLGLGFGYTLIPGIRSLTGDSDSLLNMLKNHTSYFNTHPYLASYILGAVLRLESDNLRNEVNEQVSIDTFKERFSGILGSLGDRFFWKYMRPFSSLIGISVILLFENIFPLNIILGLTLFIVFYNFVHIYYRWTGLTAGFDQGTSVIRDKSIANIEKFNNYLLSCSLFFLGIIIVLESKRIIGFDALGLTIFAVSFLTVFLFKKVLR